jgi:hypothetical protein
MLVLGRVNAAVELDRETAIGTAEIDDEHADRMLTAELQSGQLSITKRMPRHRLGTRLPRS